MSTPERSWPVPAALAALSAIPLTAGTARLIQLAGGPALVPAARRFASFPLPLMVHIVGAMPYALAGILQFVPRFRGRQPTAVRHPCPGPLTNRVSSKAHAQQTRLSARAHQVLELIRTGVPFRQ